MSLLCYANGGELFQITNASLVRCRMTDGESCWTLWSCMEWKQTDGWRGRSAAKGHFLYRISEPPRSFLSWVLLANGWWWVLSLGLWGGPNIHLQQVQHQDLLWENVKNRTPHFTDSHIKRCQVQPRESTIGGSAAPGEQQEFKRLAEQKSLSEQRNMFILTTPAESESETWKTFTAIPSAVWMLSEKTPL